MWFFVWLVLLFDLNDSNMVVVFNLIIFNLLTRYFDVKALHTFSGKTKEHFVIRRSVKCRSASKRTLLSAPGFSAEKSSISLPLKLCLFFAPSTLKIFDWYSFDSLIGIDVFVTCPGMPRDLKVPFVLCFVDPWTEAGRDLHLWYWPLENGLADGGRLTIFSSNTKIWWHYLYTINNFERLA